MMTGLEADARPKYEQTYRVILDRLKSGRYPVGGRMPTESELAKHFDVSRVTIRRALDMLVQDGYVESKQGSGYTVLTLSPSSDTCLTSFTDAMLRAGESHISVYFSGSFCSWRPFACGASARMQGNEVTRVVRLRMVDDEPSMLVMTYAPRELLRDATAQDFRKTDLVNPFCASCKLDSHWSGRRHVRTLVRYWLMRIWHGSSRLSQANPF